MTKFHWIYIFVCDASCTEIFPIISLKWFQILGIFVHYGRHHRVFVAPFHCSLAISRLDISFSFSSLANYNPKTWLEFLLHQNLLIHEAYASTYILPPHYWMKTYPLTQWGGHEKLGYLEQECNPRLKTQDQVRLAPLSQCYFRSIYRTKY